MHVFTHHETYLAHDGHEFLQVTDANDPRAVILDGSAYVDGGSPDEGPLSSFTLERDGAYTRFRRDGLYLCASNEGGHVFADRPIAGEWETFIVAPSDALPILSRLRATPEEEILRFKARVEEAIKRGEKIKIYPGCGPVPREGFINLDIQCMSTDFLISHPDDYFIFPFVCEWPIPDECVDYIFHEDFIEHITQTMQWQFLAEAWRVLRPGSWHRVNTPNILWTMRERSDFKAGYKGVYTGELKWDHISILSHMQLKEVAQTIGYREVVFTTRHHGLGSFAGPDFRPGPDRDDVVGNIYADLLK